MDRTFLLRLYAKYRRAKLDQKDHSNTQLKQLLSLVRQAQATKFGRDHEFSSIRSVADFQERVPLRKYEQFWQEYWKPVFPRLTDCTWPGTIPYFPVSSGTSSGTTKYIPCSHEMIASNAKAGMDLLVHHLTNKPNSRVLGGKSFFLGGSTDLVEEAPGIFSGDLSGIATKTLPWWARSSYFPPLRLATIKNWEEKIDILARESLKNDIHMLSGVPSWMLILVDKLSALKPEASHRLGQLYPNLELLVHGGVNFAPYHKRFCELLQGSRAELREVYPASEGFVAVGDRGYSQGMRVILDHGIFFEFVPLEELSHSKPTRHWIGTIEKDINYAVILSTCAGLWAYILGDTVKFVELDPPRLLVTGRTSYYLSAFGEHVIAEEVEDAVSFACEHLNSRVTDYSVGALYPQRPGELGGHLYVLEFADRALSPQELAEFTGHLDKRLSQRNEDYMAHRAEGFGLNAPKLQVVPPGFFAAWMKSRGKLGGQHKVPRIITDQALFSSLREFANQNISDAHSSI